MVDFLKRHWWAFLYGLLLTAFTVYVILDTFVITRVYTVVPQTAEVGLAAQEQENAADALTDGTEEEAAAGAPSDGTEEESAADVPSDETEEESSAGVRADGTEQENGPSQVESGTQSHSRKRPSRSSTEADEAEQDAGADNTEQNDPSAGTGQDAGADNMEQNDPSAETGQDAGAAGGASTTALVTENTYSDGNITIVLTEYREYDTAIYAADITLTSAGYLQTAFAQNSYGRNVTAKTSEIAEGVGAILAINGDYYGAQEKGYVIRNHVLYRSTASDGQEDLVIYEDGSFGIISENEVTAEELLADGAVQVLSFGPALITDGSISVSENDEVGKAKASNPRTAIGIIDDLHYVFVVSDGRTEESAGLSLSELAEFMSGLGVVGAYNLDGGGSSTLYFNGEVINNPTTNGKSIKERSVSDIVYIGY